MDHFCLGNFTKEILYQFAAIPTVKKVNKPVDVSKIKVQMNIPFFVEYILDRRNERHFLIEQRENLGKKMFPNICYRFILGIIKLKAPIIGPGVEIIRLYINTKSRTQTLIAHNIVFIEVHVSKFAF